MVHKFDVKNRSKLDNAERRSILPSEKTIASFNLSEGDIMADIGCGIGYFTIPTSKIVGESGRIFAMDISPEMLERLGFVNISTVYVGENFYGLIAEKQ